MSVCVAKWACTNDTWELLGGCKSSWWRCREISKWEGYRPGTWPATSSLGLIDLVTSEGTQRENSTRKLLVSSTKTPCYTHVDCSAYLCVHPPILGTSKGSFSQLATNDSPLISLKRRCHTCVYFLIGGYDKAKLVRLFVPLDDVHFGLSWQKRCGLSLLRVRSSLTRLFILHPYHFHLEFLVLLIQ